MSDTGTRISNNLNLDDVTLSKTVDWLRFPLVVLVVFIHCGTSSIDMEAMHQAPFTMEHIFLWVQILITRCLAGLAVPCFFLFSGYYFFHKVKDFSWSTYKAKVKKRWRTLIIPYLLWNGLFVLDIILKKIAAFVVKGKPLSNIAVWLQENSYHLFWDYAGLGEETNVWGYTLMRYGPIDAPLWFLRDLIVLVLLSPLIYWLVKKGGFLFVSILGMAYVLNLGVPCSGFTPNAVFFFSLGAYFSLSWGGGLRLLAKKSVQKLTVLLFAVLLVLDVWLNGQSNVSLFFVHNPLRIFGSISLLMIVAHFVRNNKLNGMPFLSKSTFFIFALHWFYVLHICKSVVHSVLPYSHPIAVFAAYLLTPTLTVCACLALNWALIKYAPKVHNLLTGNR